MKKEEANFYYFAFVHLMALSLLLIGCATKGKSAGLGAAVGAGAGAIAGGLADPGQDGEYRTRNVIIGTALGGMAGLVAGDMIHQNIEAQKKEAFLQGKAAAPPPQAGAMPTLKPARVEAQWIEGHPVGQNRWVEGHYEFIIVEPARWEN